MEKKKLGYDPNDIAAAFSLVVNEDFQYLNSWLAASYEFDAFEQRLFDEVYEESRTDAS